MPTKPASLSDRKMRARHVLSHLKTRYPDAGTALRWEQPFHLLVATILSAQSTDVRVNEVTPGLFKRYPTVADFARADLDELQKQIYTTGFFRQKAKSIKGASQMIVERFGGQVPSCMDELLLLPGVARKTANVVLGSAFGKNEGIVVDTHVGRVAVRLELAPSAKNSKDAVKIERDLMDVIPRKDWTFFGHATILHGRETCWARNPQCRDCMLLTLCPTGQRELGTSAPSKRSAVKKKRKR